MNKPQKLSSNGSIIIKPVEDTCNSVSEDENKHIQNLIIAFEQSMSLHLATYGSSFKDWIEYKTWNETIEKSKLIIKSL